MSRIRSIITLIPLLLLCGCAFNAGYNPSYISAQPLQLGIGGKGLVVVNQTDAQWTYSGHPTSFTGSGTTLTVPIGEISKQIALRVFGAAFKEGVDFRDTAGETKGYRLVVEPKVAKFTYAYNQLKNLGFAITPQVEVQLHVVLTAPNGKTLADKFYSSGLVDGDSYMLSGQPAEKVNQLLHQTIFKLMTDAAMEAKQILEATSAN
jgi:hypothetical protein